VRTTASDTCHDSMWAGATLRGAGRGGASILTGGVGFSTPLAGRCVGPAECVVAELLAISALCEQVEL
jgi:hypothetical protein